MEQQSKKNQPAAYSSVHTQTISFRFKILDFKNELMEQTKPKEPMQWSKQEISKQTQHSKYNPARHLKLCLSLSVKVASPL